MTDTEDKLSKMFTEHAEKHKAARDSDAKVFVEERNRVTNCTATLSRVAWPVLQKLSREIERHTRDAKLVNNLSGPRPSIALTFSPNLVGRKIMPSAITFECDRSGVIAVNTEVGTATGRSSPGAFELIDRGKAAPDPLTEQWVEQRVLGFVKAVLDENSPKSR